MYLPLHHPKENNIDMFPLQQKFGTSLQPKDWQISSAFVAHSMHWFTIFRPIKIA
jgi:hypothetical protein